MMKIAKYITYLIAVVLLTSCYMTRDIGLLQDRKSLPVYEKGVYQENKLRPNDELTLRIITSNKESAAMFGGQQSSNARSATSFRIYTDGTVDLPFLSKVPIIGLTLEEAERFVQEQLKPYIPDVQVKLALSTSTFCVIGDAGRGYFDIYKERLTIFQALALSGGLNESGDYSAVKIIRETAQGTKIVSFDLRSKTLIDSEYYYVYPNDIIYVDITKKSFWAINSYSGFLGIITSSITLLLTVWNLAR